MKSKKELIGISGAMDTNGNYAPFYEFASNYIMGMKERCIKDTTVFFNEIKTLSNNLHLKANTKAMGITGKDKSEAKAWCNYILKLEMIKELSLNELHFVIGYCARRAKIKKEII